MDSNHIRWKTSKVTFGLEEMNHMVMEEWHVTLGHDTAGYVLYFGLVGLVIMGYPGCDWV